MSHYGLKLLYHILNRRNDVNAERCFLPGKNSIAAFKNHNVPLFSLENKTPLKDFDLIGFSLLSEMTYTNLLQILELAQIPLHSRERDESFPLIAAGGISVINPEPLREFVDIFALGEGEALFPDMLEVLSAYKNKELDKDAALRSFAAIEGIYVPALAPLEKKGRFYRPALPAGAVKKRIIKDMDASFPDEKIIVPITNAVFDRLTVEIARGCPQNCRFCQAKSYYAPFRGKSAQKTFDYIKKALPATGFEAFSLTSLSSGDYPQLKELLDLIPRVIEPGISFSVSSLRPSTISNLLLSTISLFRRTGITIVPEAGSERLRKVINKDVSSEEIFKAVDLALEYNWQKIKLYFMLGLPTETQADVEAAAQLIEDIHAHVRSAKKRIKMHISFSTFVPKPHTPLQWAKRESVPEITEKIKFLKNRLKKYKKIVLDFHDPRNSVVETLLARGDYRVGDILLKALKKGEIFSAWDHDFHFSVWEELLEESAAGEFLQEIPVDEPLPWDFIAVNYKPEYLQAEYRRALSGDSTPCCAPEDCKACGGCLYGMKKGDPGPVRLAEESPPEQPTPPEPLPPEPDQPDRAGASLPGAPVPPGTAAEKIPPVEKQYNKVRIFYEKSGDFIFFSQVPMLKYLERLIRKSGIEFKCSGGFHPRIKIATLAPLPVYAVGLDEAAEIFVDPFLNEEQILAALKSVSPLLKIKKVEIKNSAPNLNRDIAAAEYELGIENSERFRGEIESRLCDTDVVEYRKDRLLLKIDYTVGDRAGHERFAKIYKAIDPDKLLTRYLARTRVIFKKGSL